MTRIHPELDGRIYVERGNPDLGQSNELSARDVGGANEPQGAKILDFQQALAPLGSPTKDRHYQSPHKQKDPTNPGNFHKTWHRKQKSNLCATRYRHPGLPASIKARGYAQAFLSTLWR